MGKEGLKEGWNPSWKAETRYFCAKHLVPRLLESNSPGHGCSYGLTLVASFWTSPLAPATFLSRYPMFLAVPKSQKLTCDSSFVYHLLRSLQNIQPVCTLPDLLGLSQKLWWTPPWPCESHILHVYKMRNTQTMNAKMLNSWAGSSGSQDLLDHGSSDFWMPGCPGPWKHWQPFPQCSFL